MAATTIDELQVLISAQTADFKNQIRGVQSQLNGLDETSNKTGASLSKLGNAAKVAFAAAGVAAATGIGAALKSTATYESSLSQLKQASGATTDQMEKMSAITRKLGRDSDLAGVSASDVAEAMVELSKAGLSVNDTMAATKGVLSLAKAGNIAFADAATIAASALNAFGLKGKDASKVADMLAAGANASQAQLGDLAAGLQQSATVAKQFGLEMNETVTALSLFANNGIKGSDAGTSLKTMLIALAKPSSEAASAMKEIGFQAYNAEGQFVGLEEMSKRLKKATEGLTDEQKQNALATIFGTDAFRAAAVLADNAGKSYDGMSASVGKAGAAQEAAAAQMGTLQRSWEGLGNAISDAGLSIGLVLSPYASTAADVVANLVNAFNVGKIDEFTGYLKSIDWKKLVPSEDVRKGISEIFEFGELLASGKLQEAGSKLGAAIGNGIAVSLQGLRISMDTIKAWFASINWGEVGIAVGTGALAFVAGLVIGLFSTESLMQFVGFIADNWVAVLLTVAGIAFAPAKLLAPIGKLFGTVISKLPFGPQFVSAFGKIVDVIRGFFEPIRSAFHSTFVAPLIGSASNVVKGITTVINAIKDILLTPFRLGVQVVVNVIQGIPKAVSAVITIVRSLFAPLAEYIGGLFRVGVANARNALSPLVNFVGGIVNGIKGRFADIVGWFSSKFNSIKNTISNINWGDVGANMMRGIGDGIGRMGGYLADRAKAAVGSAKDALKSFLGIHSPSRVMRDEVGKMMGLGVALGIDQSTKDAVKSARNSAKSVLGAYGGSFNTNLPSSSQLSGSLGVSIASMPEPSGRATPVNVQIDGNTLLSFVIDGVNNKAFMTNSSVIDY